MRLYFRAAVIYAAISLVIVWLRYGDVDDLIATSAVATLAVTGYQALFLVLPVIALLFLMLGRRLFRQRVTQALYAIAGAVILQVGFSFLKSSIPNFVPFYADPMLASIDRTLHGGQDGWRIAHEIAPYVGAQRLLPVYLYVWSVFVMALPTVVALTDDDEARVHRFVIVRLMIWVLLGNVLATAFASVGPVFYDRLYGGDRFADLTAALQSSGVEGGPIGRIQAYLWTGYLTQKMELASGISAFPSVHLGIATSTAIYAAERSRWLILPGVLFVATILYLSVYTGYHYAIDGYFSIAAVLLAWVGVRRWQGRSHVAASAANAGLPRVRG